jgi:hypothetical protein
MRGVEVPIASSAESVKNVSCLTHKTESVWQSHLTGIQTVGVFSLNRFLRGWPRGQMPGVHTRSLVRGYTLCSTGWPVSVNSRTEPTARSVLVEVTVPEHVTCFFARLSVVIRRGGVPVHHNHVW